MSGSKKVFIAGVSVILVLVVLLGCLPNKQGGFTCVAAPLISKIQSILPTPKKAGQTAVTGAGAQTQSATGPTRPHPPVRTGDITTGPKSESASQTIATTGGTIAITKPGDPLDGFAMEVPAASYPGSSKFKVSSAPITKQTFGSDINPISPMITVDNGGGYSEEMMYVRVPVKVPEGNFAMGFMYDEKSKQLAGIALVGSDAESVTIATRHFSSFFISMIEKALLKKDIDSGFRPGMDDWQFDNVGSYIAPGGHCEGQALTALWYYCTQPDGNGACLYGRYDNNGVKPATPDFWQDDSLGYRFCSVIQVETHFGENITTGSASLRNFWINLGGIVYDKVQGKWISGPNGIGDEATYNLFAYSIRATGEPQEVVIMSNAGGAHAMIVYKIVGNALYIADPNYHGNTDRKIIYYSGDGKFKPYNSGANKKEIDAGNGKVYERIVYSAKSTIVPWDVIARRWAEFKAGTIGNDKFATYKVVYKDDKGKWQELKDGYQSPVKLINIDATGVEAVQEGGIHTYRDGKVLKWDEQGNYELNPGDNKLGILVEGKVNGKGEYDDFKYVNVVFAESSSDRLKELQKLKHLMTRSCIEITRTSTNIRDGVTITDVLPYYCVGAGNSIDLIPITWNGGSFSGKKLVGRDYCEVSGTVSPDGNFITGLTHVIRHDDDADESMLTFANIPVTWDKENAGTWVYMDSSSRGIAVNLVSVSIKENSSSAKFTYTAPKVNERSYIGAGFSK